MPWELEIHTIDVGQGESSLIIARELDGFGNFVRNRTMLIDGGLGEYAWTVHNYVSARLAPGQGLDHIVVSHYDEDHTNGIVSLLIADNCYNICQTIAAATAAKAADGRTDAQRVAFGACAAAAVMLGAYAVLHGQDDSGEVDEALTVLKGKTIPTDLTKAAKLGISVAVREVRSINPNLYITTNRLNLVAKEAGLAAKNAIQMGINVEDSVRNTIFGVIGVPPSSDFSTGGIYAQTHVIDIGDSKNAGYAPVVEGKMLLTNNWVPAPTVGRHRTSVIQGNLGDELLWNSGAVPALPPANAPSVFLVACRCRIWQHNGAIPFSDNNEGIALILRFNKFFYYTGGDLETVGEDIIARKVMTIGLPIPGGGGALPVADRIACFKCGHHGSDHSTSAGFLNRARPRGAMISCGENAFGKPGSEDHPSQNMINRLYASADIKYFYLTNCRYIRNNVPASQSPPQNQLNAGGNKSRLAGDNAANNLQAGREPGNVVLGISQAESLLNAGDPNRRYHVRYFDADGNVYANRIEDTVF